MIARLILFVFLLFLLLTVLRGLRIFFTAVFRPPGVRGAARTGGTLEGEMIRDPVCGTWIDRRLALTGHRGGEAIAVCSEKCRRALEAAS